MSRSYKKTPVVTEQSHKHGVRTWKRLANKKVRKTKDVPNGRAYKACMCSWDINDYSFWEFKEDVIRKYYANKKAYENGCFSSGLGLWHEPNKTLEEELNEWRKYYLSK